MYYLLVPATICCGGSAYRMPTITERSCHIFLGKACSGWSYWWGLSLGWWLPSECSLVWKDAWECFWHLRWGKTYRGQYLKSLFFHFPLSIRQAAIFDLHSCFNTPGSGRNPWATKVNLADTRNHGDNSWYMLCMGVISTGKALTEK
jgi:hypothetical protein